ncbi:hypothetical protein KC902_00515 [Candidatus Kaiserbacteria bacterium]|nr:hypothetical protein [Candidatus Kaiserbacteria bacterium]USN89141.1 MAG: hypothetical protein H6780_01845 [Candidatus Nomurabacteria bacterium]
MRTIVTTFIFILSLAAIPASAQFSSNNTFTQPEFGIEIQPKYPAPGEEVTLSINDYRGSSYGANITWVLDGRVIPEAENKREAKVTTGALGTTQSVEVILTRSGGGRESLQTVIRPIYLDIIIEPQTHVPENYLGRALPSIGSTVNATALISGAGFRNPDLIYTWRFGQQVIEGGSLRGRNQVSFTTTNNSNETLSVQVATLDGSVIASRSISIPSVAPEIHFYEVSALFGMSKKTLSEGISLIGNSLVVAAEPYYLDSRVYNNPAITEWTLGNTIAETGGGNPYEVTLERTGSGGVLNLSFHVRDTTQVLQGAIGATQVNF